MRRLSPFALILCLTLPVACASLYGVSDLPEPTEADGSTDGHAGGRTDGGIDGARADTRSSDAASDAHSSSAASDARLHDGASEARHKDAASDAHRRDGVSDARTPGDAADASACSVTVNPSSAWLPQGGNVSVKVTLGAVAASAVAVSVSPLPPGVTAKSPTIPQGSTAGNIQLSATASATPGLAAPMVTACGGQSSFDLVVAAASGTLDNTFNQGGVLNINPEGGDAQWATATSVAAFPDGSIVVGGVLVQSPASGWGIVHLLEDGTHDTTFDTNLQDGTKGAALPTEGTLTAVAAMPATGQTVAVGTDIVSGVTDLAIFVINADGTRDEAFGTNGMFSRGAADGLHVASVTGLAVDSKGDIAVVGNTTTPVGFLLTMAAPGYAAVHETTSFSSTWQLTGVVVEPDDATVIIGGDAPSGGGQFLVVGVSSAFSSPVVGTPVMLGPASPSQYLIAEAMAGDPDGDVFLAGMGTASSGEEIPAVTVLTNALVSEETSGYANPGPNIENSSGYTGVASNSSMEAIAVGWGYNAANYTGFVVRFNAQGQLDKTFGTAGTGIQSTSTGVSSSTWLSYNAVAYDAFGRIIIAGNNAAAFYVARVWP